VLRPRLMMMMMMMMVMVMMVMVIIMISCVSVCVYRTSVHDGASSNAAPTAALSKSWLASLLPLLFDCWTEARPVTSAG